jgi:ATP-dependent DNA helicase RecG
MVEKGRPAILFPLFAGLETLSGIGPKSAQVLCGQNVDNPKSLLMSLPYAVHDRRRRETIQGAEIPGIVTVEVQIGRHFPPKIKGRPYRVEVQDGKAQWSVIFFHARGDYVQRQLPTGQRRVLSGKVELFDGIAQMVHPDHILPLEQAHTLPEFEPVYPLVQGVTQKAMRKAVLSALERVPELEEWIDPELVRKNAWPSWANALKMAHSPRSIGDISPDAPARARLAYDELFAHQLTMSIIRNEKKKVTEKKLSFKLNIIVNILKILNFTPTHAQNRAVSEIIEDLQSPTKMNRLLQGDVGSGKTLVALLAMAAVAEAGGQAVLMAPTEILARQHFEGLRAWAESVGLRLAVLTGRDKAAERKSTLNALESGDIDILIGTHAVFQAEVHFANLRLAVIDEQHRFGVHQRMALGKKGAMVNVLVMTATPIPRSLALAQYGDMDVSILDEKPPGRLPVKTALVDMQRLDEVVAHLADAIADGRQAYWVCPLVAESELSDLPAAEERFAMLRARLGEGIVGLVHGQLAPTEKDQVMQAFTSGQIKVLVATTVIEVGVDVPNASIMVIERAEFFGLAQLHQLRGRVGRGNAASTCLLLYQGPLGETATRRLKILRDTEDGFRIAEEDLAIRGAGDLLGTAQSGLPKFRIADLERQSGLMATAQKDARKLLHDDPNRESPRWKAARILLWLLEQEKAVQLRRIG